jgi:hypothetical protein
VRQFINKAISKIFAQVLPRQDNAFVIQKKFLQKLIKTHVHSPLYTNIWLKQDKTIDLSQFTALDIKSYLSRYPLIEYKTHILPLVEQWSGITHRQYDVSIRTSGTSDANQWWKIIPSSRSSLYNERIWLQRTLSCYLSENPISRLFLTRAFALTASFDIINKIWYISGIIRYANRIYKYYMLPSDRILGITDRNMKRKEIVEELLWTMPSIWSFHGVPTWSLDIIHDLIREDMVAAKKILSLFEYISIWWWPALSYKQQFQSLVSSLWLSQQIYGSNHHNASEWFLWSQVGCFADLEYQWMCPVMQTNFFLFVPIVYFDSYRLGTMSYHDMIIWSSLLHEVQAGQEYLMLFANDRIPWLYNIKDKVIFRDNSDESLKNIINNTTHNHHDWYPSMLLEYIVTWRYGMASNICNEHIESEHIIACLVSLGLDSYHRVGGMQEIDNSFVFHLIVEGEYDVSIYLDIDTLLWQLNHQWVLFRSRGKIKELVVHFFPLWSLRQRLIDSGKMHEQSKIPHLSDANYIQIVEPLLAYL